MKSFKTVPFTFQVIGYRQKPINMAISQTKKSKLIMLTYLLYLKIDLPITTASRIGFHGLESAYRQIGRSTVIDMRASETGFGLIEMMVVVLLIAILATIAVPSFRNLVAETQVNSEANTLITAFNTARSYAIRHNTQVKLCAGSNSNCVAGATLASGWVIKKKNSSKIIRKWSKPSTTINSSFNQSVTYKPNGLLKNRQSGYVRFCDRRHARKVLFNAVGNLQLRCKKRDLRCKKSNCSNCTCHP